MTKPIPTQLSVPSSHLILALLALFLSGCEKEPPPGSVGVPQTSQTAACEKFPCADIERLNALRIHVQEQVGIGIPKEHQIENELEVNGTILAEEILVKANVADYVFATTYDLKSLESIEAFIQEHHHLPGVPQQSSVEASGNKIPLGDSYGVLLEKIEELTLYAIEQNKRIYALEKFIAQQLAMNVPTRGDH